jgi:hypothetical protein
MKEMGASKPSWNLVLARTYALYGQQFGTFLKIALLPALITSLYGYAYRVGFRQAVMHGWLDQRSIGNVPLMAALGVTQGGIYWIISGFFFAAVASHVLGEPGDESSPLSDAFSAARSRIGAVVGVTMLAWVLFYFGRIVSGIAVHEVFGGSALMRNYWAVTFIVAIPLLLVAGGLSRLGLAIPALIAQPDLTVSQSLKESVASTRGWEAYFMMFLAKSAVLGFLGYWVANVLLERMWVRGLLTRATYPWAQTLLYLGIAMTVETPLFISFAVLYRELRSPEETALRVKAIG